MKSSIRRIRKTWLTIASLALSVVLIFSVQAAGPTCTTWNSPTGYSVQLCLSAPSNGDIIGGMTTVTANITIVSGTSSGRSVAPVHA